MAHKYVYKKNGLWNIFSTITDSYLLGNDATLDELEIIETSEAVELAKENVRNTFNRIRKGEKPRLIMSEDEATEIINFRNS